MVYFFQDIICNIIYQPYQTTTTYIYIYIYISIFAYCITHQLHDNNKKYTVTTNKRAYIDLMYMSYLRQRCNQTKNTTKSIVQLWNSLNLGLKKIDRAVLLVKRFTEQLPTAAQIYKKMGTNNCHNYYYFNVITL